MNKEFSNALTWNNVYISYEWLLTIIRMTVEPPTDGVKFRRCYNVLQQ